jgi:glyoxylase I family protein
MRIEHVAMQVHAPAQMADWYIKNLGFRYMKSEDAPVPVRFIADDTGRVMLEIYCNPSVSVPDYSKMDPLHLHVAFVCEEIGITTERLVKAGALQVGPAEVKPNGDVLAMLRDPWGIPIQLCKRGIPMV